MFVAYLARLGRATSPVYGCPLDTWNYMPVAASPLWDDDDYVYVSHEPGAARAAWALHRVLEQQQILYLGCKGGASKVSEAF